MDAKVKAAVKSVVAAARPATWLPTASALRFYDGTDKYWHGYSPAYRRHLTPGRFGRSRVLEIGVGGYQRRATGGSLRFWRDFFPRAAIVGMDLYDKTVRLGGRVTFVQGDQASPADLDRAVHALGGPPDVVIDDGSHVGEHIWASFTHLFPTMPSGAVYVVEDLHTSYWAEFGGTMPAPDNTGVGLVRQAVDEVQRADPTFARHPEYGPAPVSWSHGPVNATHVYPGVAFLVHD